MRIGISCGSSKEAGYLGIDRIAGPDVDIVCDISQGIPLPDNTAEFVMASRVLPYIEYMGHRIASWLYHCQYIILFW
ncbi:hypothetical protein D3C76_435570 [compost metagenome]